MREPYSTSEVPAPIGAYSQACRIGDVVAVSGQVGLAPGADGAAGPDVASQTDQALANVAAALAAADCTLDDVLRLDCYLTDTADFAAFDEAVRRWFPATPPARTTVVVGLAAGFLVEITALAVVPRPDGRQS